MVELAEVELVCQLDYAVYDAGHVGLYYQLFIVFIHLLEEVYAAQVYVQVVLCLRQEGLELFFVLDIIPYEHSQKIVGGV